MLKHRVRVIHFVGIGGVGMSGIAEVLLDRGFEIKGSDIRRSDRMDLLEKKGATIYDRHCASNIQGVDVVVYSSAIRRDNPELVAAYDQSIPVISRAKMLGELVRFEYGIAVTGSHGKTTTASLIATILRDAGLDPSVIIGGTLNSLGSGSVLGQGDFMVVEADESDGSFVHLSPIFSVLTNIDCEHLEHYGSMDALKKAFLQFSNQVPFYGALIAYIDDPNIEDVLSHVDRPVITYGTSEKAVYRALHHEVRGLHVHFDVYRHGEFLSHVILGIPGRHHILNALAAIALADELKIPHSIYFESLRNFSGIRRRFSLIGDYNILNRLPITIIDDYAHHPKEIVAVLQTAREMYSRRLVVVFQPHRYSRTRLLFQGFSQAFKHADMLVICDVYAAGETMINGATSQDLAFAIKKNHNCVHYVPKQRDLAGFLVSQLQLGDVVITLGAGDITKTGPELLALLKTQKLFL